MFNEIPNLLEIAYNQIQDSLRAYTGKSDLEIEVQLLNSEFTEVELYDISGTATFINRSTYLEPLTRVTSIKSL